MTQSAWNRSPEWSRPSQPHSQTSLQLLGWGLCSPLGTSARESSLGYRAGCTSLAESAALTPSGESPTIALYPVLSPYLAALQRAQSLLLAALDDLAAQWNTEFQSTALQGRTAKVFLLLNEDLPNQAPLGPPMADQLGLFARESIRERLGTPCQVETRTTGPAGLGEILQQAERDLAENQYELAVVCATHTDHDPARLAFLDQHRRIHSAEQLDGILLGEAAGVLIFSSGTSSRSLQLRSHANVHPGFTAHEKASFDNDESAYAAGALTLAARNAIAQQGSSTEKVGWLSTDASFEMFRVQELQAVMTRIQSRLGPPQILECPNQRIGHLGAVMGIWQIVYAAEAWLLGFAPDRRKLCFLGSDSGVRAAFFVERNAD